MNQSDVRGFSLLEVLVAFSILALTLGVLMQIFSGSLRNAHLAHDQAQAVALAQSLLASAGVESPLVAGKTDGQLDGRFDWSLQVHPYLDELPASTAPQGSAIPRFELLEVTVEVSWGEGFNSTRRSFKISSLRLNTSSAP